MGIALFSFLHPKWKTESTDVSIELSFKGYILKRCFQIAFHPEGGDSGVPWPGSQW